VATHAAYWHVDSCGGTTLGWRAIAVFAGLLAGLAGTLWQAREADIKARQAEWERDRARD